MIKINKIVQEDLEIISQENLPWGQFRNSTILITGSTGYIGGWVVETLFYLNQKFKLNLKILLVGKSVDNIKKKFEKHLGDSYYTSFIFSNLDLSVVSECHDYLGDVNYVFHCAGIADPVVYTKNPVGTVKINTLGTMILLDALSSNCKGFLFLSSGWANGIVTDNQIPTKETDYGKLDTMDVVSCYGESKRMGENICASYYKQYFIPTKVARISYAYGPMMNLDNDNRVVASFISSIIKNQKIIMNSEGRATRSFCYISDIVTALFTILLKGCNGQVYNASNGTENSIKDVIFWIREYFLEKYDNIDISFEKDGIFRPNRTCLSGDKLKKLDWQPKYDLEEGIKRTVESYLE
jgi:nucleoside-diphosphate-sugar epimerase